ncbi:MAG: AsmA family protein [Oligoflexia bacterium]|nr:AsmA family protein [Oligoflexia bacterium]
MLKKLLIFVGVLVGLFVLALVLVPLFVDANKFRPQIVKTVEDNLNADLELGNLKLSLWGGVNIQIEKLVLSEKGSQGKAIVFAMTDAKLKVPFSSILSGNPSVTLVVQKPQIRVVSGLDGKLNVSKLMKPAAPGSEAAKAQEQAKADAAAGKSSGGSGALPVELSFNIVDGQVTYLDEKANTKTEITGFDFDLLRFGVNKPFNFKMKSNLNVQQMKELTLKGSFTLEGKAGIYMASNGFEKLDLDADADMTDLVVRYTTLMNKTDKVPLKLGVTLTTTDKNLKITRGHLQIADAAVDSVGTIDNFDAPVVNMTLTGKNFNFEHWQQALAPLKDFDMKGGAEFNIKISGPVSKLVFDGKANVNNASLQAPGIVPRVTDMNANLNFTSDTAAISKASLKIGASDLSMDGTIRNFSKPVIVVNVNSKLLDVDSMLPQKTPEQKKADAAAAKQEEQAQQASGQTAPDAEKSASGPISVMKKNPTARAVDFTGRMKVAKIIVNKAELTSLDTELTFKDLVMALKKASASAFGGNLNFNSTIDFRGVDPTYSASGDVSALDINAAITNQMPVMKDTVLGKVYSKFAVNGSGLSKPKVKQSMKGNGNFRIEKGTWSALKAMQGVGEKLKSIPGAKDKLGAVDISGKFKQLKSDFTISDGKFNIVGMIADMEEGNTGVNGNGFVDFDMNLSLAGKILIPGGGDVPGELKNSDGRTAIPYEMGCSATSPCLKMDGPAQIVAKAYLKKEGGAAVKKALEKIDNPQVKELLKKLPF